jgi:hypothetical protein
MAHKLYELLERLDAARWHYTLHRTQADQVMIWVTLVGQRIEIYVSAEGDVGYSIFTGSEDVEIDLAALLDLLKPDV